MKSNTSGDNAFGESFFEDSLRIKLQISVEKNAMLQISQ
jgi:hypothetical protein